MLPQAPNCVLIGSGLEADQAEALSSCNLICCYEYNGGIELSIDINIQQS